MILYAKNKPNESPCNSGDYSCPHQAVKEMIKCVHNLPRYYYISQLIVYNEHWLVNKDIH